MTGFVFNGGAVVHLLLLAAGILCLVIAAAGLACFFIGLVERDCRREVRYGDDGRRSNHDR